MPMPRREIGDVAARPFGQWPAARQMVVAARGLRMESAEKRRRAETVPGLARIGGPGENIVARLENGGVETVTGAQFGVCRRHCRVRIKRAQIGSNADN